MAEDGMSENARSAASADTSTPTDLLTRREWAFLILWPWLLALAVPVAHSGEASATQNAFAYLLCGSVVVIAFIGGTSLSREYEQRALRDRVRRAGTLALALGGVSLPAFAAMSLSTNASAWGVLLASAFITVCGYAFLMVSAATKGAYPGIAAAWLGAPPFLFYLMLELFAVRVDAVLLLGPASGAVVAAYSGSALYGFFTSALVPALVGVALSVFSPSVAANRPSG